MSKHGGEMGSLRAGTLRGMELGLRETIFTSLK